MTFRNPPRIPVLALAALLALLPAVGFGEVLTQQQGEAILEELKQIRKLLERMETRQADAPAQRRGTPREARVSTAGRPVLGDPEAPVTLVEFADYECPFCHRFFTSTYPLIKKDYIDTGKVRLVVKDLPLGFHPNAREAAQAAHCAGEQNAFWPMRDTLYRNARKLDQELLPQYARILSLDVEAFEACLASDRHLDEIDQDAAEARKARITGTPTFVIGKTKDDMVGGPLIIGAQPYAVFRSRIDAALETPAGAGS